MKMQKTQKFGLVIFLLCNFVLMTFAQHHSLNRRTVQSVTRIKLPSDIAFTHESHDNIEGETCYNLVRRVNGICTLPNQCPEAIKDFKKGIQPQICNYKGHLPIICCPRPVTTLFQPESPTTPSITTRFTQKHTTETITSTVSGIFPLPSTANSPNFHRISERKCIEYMKLSIEENVVTTLSLNPENRPVQKSKCRKSSSEGFVVGGTKSELGEFAHMAAIGWQKEDETQIQWNCGGSLIR